MGTNIRACQQAPSLPLRSLAASELPSGMGLLFRSDATTREQSGNELSIAAVFTLFLTPVLYLGLARWSKPRACQGERLAAELEQTDRSAS